MKQFKITKEYTVKAEIYIDAVNKRTAELYAEDIDLDRVIELEASGIAETELVESHVVSGEHV